MRVEDRGLVLAGERQRAGDGLVEQTSERVDVRARRRGAALDQLGCDVGKRAEHLTGRGDARGILDPTADAEVGEVGAITLDEHVRRLHVTVDEPVRVRTVERAGNLLEQRHRALAGERPVHEQRGEIVTGDEAHREEEHAVLLADALDRHDARVVEARREPGLAQEALAERRVEGERRGDQLERHRVPRRRITREIDDTHATATEHALEPEARPLHARARPVVDHRRGTGFSIPRPRASRFPAIRWTTG